MLRPGSHQENMVHHDPATGMPEYLYGLIPAVAPPEPTAMWDSALAPDAPAPAPPCAAAVPVPQGIAADSPKPNAAPPQGFSVARLDDMRGITFAVLIKKGKSGPRHADYSNATTVGEYHARCTAPTASLP